MTTLISQKERHEQNEICCKNTRQRPKEQAKLCTTDSPQELNIGSRKTLLSSVPSSCKTITTVEA